MEQTSKYQRSIDRLNDALGKEISTTLQYIYFHTIFEDAGYEHLARLMRRISIAEMEHIEHIAERILFLNGKVDMNPSHKVQQIDEPVEAFYFAVKLEQSTIDSYNEYSRLCAAEDDAVTHKIFRRCPPRRRNTSTFSAPSGKTSLITAHITSPCNPSPTANTSRKERRESS